MKIAALRSLSKLNRDVLQNSRRLFSFKFEMTAANRFNAEQSAEESKGVSGAPEEPSKSAPFRYTVCQGRSSPVERPSSAGDVVEFQKQSVKAAIEEQQLQPAMLPEFFQKQMEKNALMNPDQDSTEQERINKPSNQRRFQVSKTYANAILPLKSVKLANPFPEPVKIMMSRTVSDEEKAEQMLAESRSQRSFSDWSSKSPAAQNYRSFSTSTKRFYSSSKSVGSDPDKCKKLKKAVGGCPKMKLPNCPPPARTRCDRLAKQIHCKKQEAPYPAYSEFCHEDIDEKPSECKLCPWKPEENPNFKPSKKNFHTSSLTMVKRTGLETTDFGQGALDNDIVIDEPEGMQCDLRKPQCERPKNRRCPPTKEEKKKQEEKKKKKKEKECMAQILEEEVLSEKPSIFTFAKGGKDNKKSPQGHGTCKIKKFPFPGCCERKQEEAEVGRCPPKKKKPKIRDCPRDEKKCQLPSSPVEGFLMRDTGEKKNNVKCPVIDMTVQKDEDFDERCKRKKKDNTKICPGDLLKKKRRKPRRKASGANITPLESKTEISQPTRTV